MLGVKYEPTGHTVETEPNREQSFSQSIIEPRLRSDFDEHQLRIKIGTELQNKHEKGAAAPYFLVEIGWFDSVHSNLTQPPTWQ